MHIDFHLEEESAEAALKNLVPKIVSRNCTVAHRHYSGKRDLLKKLPARLCGYAAQHLPQDFKIVVLADEDRSDCHDLKNQLERAAHNAGLATKTESPNGPFTVLNRIAIEELEAWFLGDFDALAAAFPRVPSSLGSKAEYRDPDAIKGGTWECLERLLQRKGYYPSGLPKIEVAGLVSYHMDPARNRSRSFRVFVEGLRAL